MTIRYLLTIFLMGVINLVSAQNNYCDDLVSDTDKVKNTITLHSPELNIILKRIQSDNGEQMWFNFNVKHLSEFVAEEGGLFIRFDDGKILRYFGQAVKHTFISNREGYYYQTDLLIKPDDLPLFREKKIKRYQIAGIDVPVTDELAIQISAYAVCMKETN